MRWLTNESYQVVSIFKFKVTPHEREMTMTSKLFISTLALAACLTTTGCQQTAGNNSTTGALLGGASGAIMGSSIGGGSGRVAATMLGAFIGTVIGSEIGGYMDELDKQKADHAFVRATKAPVGHTIAWNNPNSGHYGYVKPVRDGVASNGDYCREFQTQITVGGKSENAYGTACQKPDGSWKIIS